MSTDEYVPTDEDFIDSWAYTHVTPHDMTAEEAKDAARAFIARVRRDAAREAWTDCVSEASALGWLHPSAALDMLDRNPHEETP